MKGALVQYKLDDNTDSILSIKFYRPQYLKGYKKLLNSMAFTVNKGTGIRDQHLFGNVGMDCNIF